MRNAAYFATGILLILIQANLYRALTFVHINGASPSLILPLIIFLGVHEQSLKRGAFLAFGFGYFLDVVASAPMWLFTFISVAIFWLSRVAGVRLTAQTVLTRMALGFGFSIVESAIVLTLLAVFGQDTRRPLELAQIILPRAAATALFAPIVFRIAQKLHQSTQSVHGATEGAAR